MTEETLEVPAGRPAAGARGGARWSPTSRWTTSRWRSAVGYPPEEVRQALAGLAAEYAEQGRGFDLRNVAGGWRFYTREELAPRRREVRARRAAGPAHPGGAGDARGGGLPAAGQPGPGLGDPRRQRRRRDAHAGLPRAGRGGRAGRRRPPRSSTAPPATSWSASASTSLAELPELAPFLPDLDDIDDLDDPEAWSVDGGGVAPEVTDAASSEAVRVGRDDRGPARPTTTGWSGCRSCSRSPASPAGASARS